MKATIIGLLALLMLASPFAAMAAAQEEPADGRDLQIEVSTGVTDRLGGGEWVKIEVGTTVLAVVYGTADTNPNSPKILVEYERYLGAAEVYNVEEELLGTHPLPVRTFMAQSFEAMFEFADRDGDGLFHVPDSYVDLLLDDFDFPRKALSLKQEWVLEDLLEETNDDRTLTTVTFNISAYDLPYNLVRPEDATGDGVLNQITLSFEVNVDLVEKTLDVPIYKIVIDEAKHIVTSEVNRTESVTGVVVDGDFKYDHYIEGWDWGGDDSRLALATGVMVGNFVPEAVARIVHLTFAEHGREDGNTYDAARTVDGPTLITADSMQFEDEWERIGRLRWVSDVEVDGVMMRMSFQLHRVQPLGMRIAEGGAFFRGLMFGGAFVYPQGEVIFHDPSLNASVFVPNAAMVGPFAALAPYIIQLGVASLAIVGLVAFRALRRKPQA
ncbi:MAG: hypothetical protein ACE5JE_05630 [Thermoplasmata archaeon]